VIEPGNILATEPPNNSIPRQIADVTRTPDDHGQRRAIEPHLATVRHPDADQCAHSDDLPEPLAHDAYAATGLDREGDVLNDQVLPARRASRRSTDSRFDGLCSKVWVFEAGICCSSRSIEPAWRAATNPFQWAIARSTGARPAHL
jgi:hypothetical protein